MTIVVEFFGIPRERVGVGQVQVCDGVDGAKLEQVIAEVSARFPDFANDCTHDGRVLQNGYIVSIDGHRFVQAADNEVVSSGQSVLILSADAGG